jgi:hypothetical protein
MTARDEVFEGSCLCGGVRYRIAGMPGEMWHCHCTDCRKSHGAVFASSVQVDRRNFTLLGGESLLVTYEATTGTRRSFCGRCGSNVSGTITSEPDSVYVTAATLDTPLERSAATHIFVRSRVPWFEIRDGLPQHATYPGDGE